LTSTDLSSALLFPSFFSTGFSSALESFSITLGSSDFFSAGISFAFGASIGFSSALESFLIALGSSDFFSAALAFAFAFAASSDFF